MANEEHLRILKQGVDVWNKWREENPEVIPDLSGANLYKADLREVDLCDADLSGADLSCANLDQAVIIGADLRGTDLREAVLRYANFSLADLREVVLNNTIVNGADFSGANLIQVDFIDVDLTGADFTDADLTKADFLRANLSQANLIGADFREARLGLTILGNVDLSEVQGLETVEHAAPSTIGIDTIYRSRGNIPEVFLRGAGVPEVFIEYIRSLVANPIEFYSCFISYSHEDKAFARRLHDGLQGRGIRCWLDDHQMLPGDDIYERVDQGIRMWDKVLLCCSKASLTSWWVDNEIDTAFDQKSGSS